MKSKLLTTFFSILLFTTLLSLNFFCAEAKSDEGQIYILTNSNHNFQKEYLADLKELKRKKIKVTEKIPEIGLIEVENNEFNRKELQSETGKNIKNASTEINSKDVHKGQSWDIKMVAKRKASKSFIKNKGENIKIGVLDSGVSTIYKKNQKNILPSSQNFVKNPSTNMVEDKNNIKDEIGHGTQVLSQLAGSQYNQGIIPNAKFNVYKIYSSKTVKSTWAMEAIIQSAKNNDDILNISSGKYLLTSGTYKTGGNDNIEYQAWQRAVNYAYSKGTLIVSSLGEEGIDENNNDLLKKTLNKRQTISQNKGIVKDVPANLKNVISIGSLNPDNQVSSFSNYENSSFYTPGGGMKLYKKYGLKNYTQNMIEKELIPVYSLNGPTYSYGTSLSSPKAAGIIGYLIEKDNLHNKPEITRQKLNFYRKNYGNNLTIDNIIREES
ncbi:S8 family serine peptidase [Staphylococcus gallinarum]|uniref:S8 family serine peptidase n=1 Tax=Staphylococcus gallinarum TaxID=1293 RepID=UPI002DB8B87C|nr:S8 family serine peptidase [Staphylococcus gallinarum]MEB6243530.1 S8 family serine peptidase [Staphylococcus gallinarum]MEB6296570.1 S8 family serine peptidase [Staphylococcus gallinarum]